MIAAESAVVTHILSVKQVCCSDEFFLDDEVRSFLSIKEAELQ